MQYNSSKSVKVKVQHYLERPGFISYLGFRLWRLYCYLCECLIPERRRARQADEQFDRQLGADTQGWIHLGRLRISRDNAASGIHSEAVGVLVFRQAVKSLPIKPENFIFVDFGSGKGRALLLAATLPFKRIIGIEFSPELHATANENIRRAKCKNIETVCSDVLDYQIPPEPSVFFFFNPFKEAVMGQVLENIRRSLTEFPREAFVLYCNPVLLDMFDRNLFDPIRTTRQFAVLRAAVNAVEAEQNKGQC